MNDAFKIDVCVDIECKNCGKRTAVPALKVDPGVKCQYCGAVLALTVAEYAMKTVLISAAGNRNDVNLG